MQRERTQSALSHDILAPVRAQGPELVSGSGAELFDAEGRRYIALNELSVCLGAGNRHFIEVMQQALSRPAQSGAVNPYKARLYERLLEATNGDFSYIHLTSSGSEAAEWAVKLARKLAGKTEVVVGEPKSETSKRLIPLTDYAAELCGRMSAPGPAAFVLTGQAGRFMEPRTMQYRLAGYTKACGLENVNFHALRHTFATRCVEVDFEIKSLSEILGHSTVKVTLDRYVHSSIELKRENMQKLPAIGF